MIYFVIKPSLDQYVVLQKAKNNEILNSSERIKDYKNTLTNIKAVIAGTNARQGTRFKVVDMVKNETFNFQVDHAENGEKTFVLQELPKAFTKVETKRYSKL